MATVAQIITYAELMYPRANDISEANQIIILNQVQDEVYNKLLRVEHGYVYSDTDTVSGQADYSLPSDCTVDNIVKVMVSQDLSVDVDSETEWDEYEYTGVLDNFDLSSGDYYTFYGSSLYLFSDGAPIATTGLKIRIFYYQTPATITATTETPEIHSKYHNLLKYGLIQNIACIGDNPDTALADYWQRKFDEELLTAKNNLQDKFDSAPLQSSQTEEYW